MKITKLLWLILFIAPFAISAQNISDNTIGLRLGDSDGFGAEISYQKKIGTITRIEASFGWRDSRDYDAFKLSGLYQWVQQLDGDFNWFYGVGGGFRKCRF